MLYIDDFSLNPAPALSQILDTSDYVNNQTGMDTLHVIGGERLYEVDNRSASEVIALISVASEIYLLSQVPPSSDVDFKFTYGNTSSLNVTLQTPHAYGFLASYRCDVTGSVHLTVTPEVGAPVAVTKWVSNTGTNYFDLVWRFEEFSGIDFENDNITKLEYEVTGLVNCLGFRFDNLEIAYTPEPTGLALLALGCLLIRGTRRRNGPGPPPGSRRPHTPLPTARHRKSGAGY